MERSQLREREVQANGLRHRIIEGPDGARPTLVLLHGITGRAESWEDVLPALVDDYHVVAPDLRGHGASDKPQTGYRPIDYAADVAALLDALGVARAAVVGHSLGALVTMALAAGYPDKVSCAVLEDPPTGLDEQGERWLQWMLDIKRLPFEETYRQVRENNPQGSEEDWRRSAENLHRTADGPIADLLHDRSFRGEFFTTLARIACPVLLLQADPARGAACPDAAVEQARRALPGLSARRFPETGHAIHRERPQAFLDALRPFLAAHST